MNIVVFMLFALIGISFSGDIFSMLSRDLRDRTKWPLEFQQCQVGAYTLQSYAGKGAEGMVFKAIDARDKSVAIKLSKNESDIEKERSFLSRVQSENVVSIVEGEPKSCCGYHCIIMDWVEGETLTSVTAKKLKSNEKISLIEAKEIASGVLKGLDAMAKVGFTNPDQNPGNVMIANGRVTLIDLGKAVPDLTEWTMAFKVSMRSMKELLSQDDKAKWQKYLDACTHFDNPSQALEMTKHELTVAGATRETLEKLENIARNCNNRILQLYDTACRFPVIEGMD